MLHIESAGPLLCKFLPSRDLLREPVLIGVLVPACPTIALARGPYVETVANSFGRWVQPC